MNRQQIQHGLKTHVWVTVFAEAQRPIVLRTKEGWGDKWVYSVEPKRHV